ncbi:MAG: hypothetical protein KDA58_05790 [Planctomycetaceae bacterium]|nr:hypothetical protein [Planctomycetaceae bacterium]
MTPTPDSATVPPVQVLHDGAHAGQYNMDLDAGLLDAAVRQGYCALRLYQWQEPTISLGHFQDVDDPVVQQRFQGLPRVKRLSGGGAILHDRELTYSCVLPKSHPASQSPGKIYDLMHAGLINVLMEFGVTCRMRGAPLTGPEPFLCFGRGDPRDVVVGNHKIIGSAQRRRAGAVLQHGSILLAKSPFAPEFPGVAELTGIAIDVDQLAATLQRRLAPLLGTPCPITAWPESLECVKNPAAGGDALNA